MRTTDPDAVIREYEKLAPRYDRRWSFYIEATLRETLKRFELRSGESLLDIGCGTGVLLQTLLASSNNLKLLAGTDPSPEMLGVARQKLGKAVVLQQSNAEDVPFPDQIFDVVVSTNAFHYFHNPPRALKEMDRVLRPGGRLVITDWCDDYLTCRLCGMWLRAMRRGHFCIYGLEQCRQLVEQAGLTGICIDRYKINWLWGLMTVTARKRSIRQND